jgi:hypothetical protein
VDSEAGKTQEAMLSWYPIEFDWDRDASESVVFHEELCSLLSSILDKSAEQ